MGFNMQILEVAAVFMAVGGLSVWAVIGLVDYLAKQEQERKK